MLQISQTENPIFSATIDQIRLRRAMNLPLEFQNFSFSGFQSEIQLVARSLIEGVPWFESSLRPPRRVLCAQQKSRSPGTHRFPGAAALPVGPSLDLAVPSQRDGTFSIPR